jgi:hypothetical protein
VDPEREQPRRRRATVAATTIRSSAPPVLSGPAAVPDPPVDESVRPPEAQAGDLAALPHSPTLPHGPVLPRNPPGDSPAAWGDPADPDDEALVREVPPHWA